MENKASIVRMVLAILAALKLILQPFGIDISDDFIDALANVVGAVVVVYTMFRNNYLTKRGRQQQKILKVNNLD